MSHTVHTMSLFRDILCLKSYYVSSGHTMSPGHTYYVLITTYYVLHHIQHIVCTKSKTYILLPSQTAWGPHPSYDATLLVRQ